MIRWLEEVSGEKSILRCHDCVRSRPGDGLFAGAGPPRWPNSAR